jgi:serine protease Do
MPTGSPKRGGIKRKGPVIGAVLALVLVAGGTAAVLLRSGIPGPGDAVTRSASKPGKAMTYAEVFERVSPAVVSINVTITMDPHAGRQLPFGFGLDDEEQNEQGEAPEEEGQPQQQRASGSGFFISPDGLVLTNNHVVQEDGEIEVALKDGRELKATVVGRDETTDLALLKVSDPKDPKAKFPFVNFEDASKPRVGDWIIAIGNPFGFGGTATAGIVSAYGRDIGQGVDFMQIDAPINRGNSGGPTFDAYGRVVGVNTAIYSPSGGSVGIGFAVPADQAAAVARQLMSGKVIRRGYIGASVGTITPGLAESEGLKGVTTGALVAGVAAGGPADRGGLKDGDVVIAVDGQKVETSGEMTRAVGKAKPGQIIRLSVIRDGRRRTVIVRAGTRPPERELAGPERQRGAG